MRKKNRPLERETKVVRDASLVVIASEDRYAVKQYFDFFESSRIQFKILETEDGNSAPQHVLNRLNEYIEEYQIGKGDTFWLVCDCDHWIEPGGHIRNLTQVLQECRQKGIEVAISNPCFELWLYLHFADFPTDDALTCDEVGERLKIAANGYDKKKIYNLPIDDEKVTLALKRSEENPPNRSAIPSQPQTDVHRIIEELVKKKIISVRAEVEYPTPKRKRKKNRKSAE